MTVIDHIEGETYRSDNTDNDVFDEEENLHISEDSPIASANEYDTIKKSKFSVTLPNKSQKNVRRTTIPIKKGSKPSFLKLFDSTKVKENSALLLACQAVGAPMPEISW